MAYTFFIEPDDTSNTGKKIRLLSYVNGSSQTIYIQSVQAFQGGLTDSISASGVVSAVPGALMRAIVTSAASGSCVFYDNASAGSGTIIGGVPANAPLYSTWEFKFSAANGIYAAFTGSAPTLTVQFEQNN